MELALALLIVTSLSCTGLLATWAATSTRSWFVRITVYFGILALVLLIPAVEVLACFALQGLVILFGVHTHRFFSGNRQSKQNRYSLLTLLQVTTLVAVGIAVAVSAPPLNWPAWQSILLIGSVSGLATLLALWVVHGLIIRWWLRLAVCLVTLPFLAVPLVIGDWLFLSFETFESWPPEASANAFILNMGVEWSALVWIPMLMGIVSCLLLFFLLHHLVGSGSVPRIFSKMLAIGSLLAVGLVTALPPTVMYFKMITPLPIPEDEHHKINGYDDLVEAGKMLEGTPIDTGLFDYEFATQKQLEKIVSASANACELARQGLSKPCYVPVDYTSMQAFEDTLFQKINFGTLARAFQAEVRLAELNGEHELAIRFCLQTFKFGYAIRNQGLLVDGLSGIARGTGGLRALFQLIPQLSAEQCLDVIQKLKAHSADPESFEDFWYRDCIWVMHVTGWHSRLQFYLAEFTGDYHIFFEPMNYRILFLAEEARIQLLITELALQAHFLDNGKRPDSLSTLVPKYLDRVPLDPLDPKGKPLRYRLEDQYYILYSVGFNQTDESGSKPPKDEFGDYEWHEGDMLSKIEFALSEPVETDDSQLEIDKSPTIDSASDGE